MFLTGEQGKVEESMREMAAIEALKSEKTEKEVSHHESGLDVCVDVDGDVFGVCVARASATDRHVRRFRASKAACV